MIDMHRELKNQSVLINFNDNMIIDLKIIFAQAIGL